MNEQTAVLARRWRQARQGPGIYRQPEGRIDGRRFEGLAKLVVSVHRRAMERQLAESSRQRWAA